MSQPQQLRRPQTDEPIKYGDVFPTVQGELADQPIKPQDAAMMQSVENLVMGKTQKGGPAAVMQSAATKNERAGTVGHDDVSEFLADRGVTVTETDLPGSRVVTESVAGQVVGKFASVPTGDATAPVTGSEQITIGEALEAAALTAGDKPVDQSDADAIQAAEIRATGINENIPGGVAAAAQAAASANVRVMNDEDKTTLDDVLSDATTQLPSDKGVTRIDAERVVAAEMGSAPTMATTPDGVASYVTAAARLNEQM